MELKLEQEDVREIILAWAEREMPGKFNRLTFGSFGKDVTLESLKPKKEDKKENE